MKVSEQSGDLCARFRVTKPDKRVWPDHAINLRAVQSKEFLLQLIQEPKDETFVKRLLRESQEADIRLNQVAASFRNDQNEYIEKQECVSCTKKSMDPKKLSLGIAIQA
jgi:hypothetical protein